jgi:purine nucleosidase
MNFPRKIILDTDPALGVKLGTDIDDDLAIMMILGSPEIELLGVTCTYGNSSINRTFHDATRLLKLAAREDIPVEKGAGWLTRDINRETAASRFIAETIRKNPGNITMVTLGPLTNLATAINMNPGLMDDVNELVMMGGRLVSGRGEFNFSAHPAATNLVLQTRVPKALATMELCIQALFKMKQFRELQGDPSLLIHPFLPAVRRWLKINRTAIAIAARNRKDIPKGGFFPWDPVAIAYILDPSIFPEIIPIKAWMQEKRVMVSRDVAGMDEKSWVKAPARMNQAPFMELLIQRIKQVKRKS